MMQNSQKVFLPKLLNRTVMKFRKNHINIGSQKITNMLQNVDRSWRQKFLFFPYLGKAMGCPTKIAVINILVWVLLFLNVAAKPK